MASPETFDIPIGKVVGPKGDTGNGIESIELLSTSGLNKTYRITMTDETTFDFTVTDGNGITGASFDAQTNALTLTFDNGTSFTTPSLKGTKGDTGNGISRIEKTGTEGLVDTYTVTYTNGQTYTYTVTNGADGASDAESVTYDDTETYTSGTIGKAVSDLSRQLSDLETRLKSGDEEDADLHLGFYLDENGDLCQVDEEVNNG